MRWLFVVLAALAVVPAGAAQLTPAPSLVATRVIGIHYRAHDGSLRPALLLVPMGYDGKRPLPLVISPHGRGVGAVANMRIWGDLPGEGGFAVINPAGEGRRLHQYSWGYRGQIDDLARMPRIVAAHGIRVERSRIYAIGGSMGGQETLLLAALHPHLLAGAAAFDPATDMRRRYADFARMKGGALLQALARTEIGGTPAQVPAAYAARSPDTFAARLAKADIPIQLYWSTQDRIIRDQRLETQRLALSLRHDDDDARLWDFTGAWQHTSEMRASKRLPRAVARFGLLPWRDVPPLPPPRLSRLARVLGA
jgi:poly(3-hydroxybutyrate) depolymerase